MSETSVAMPRTDPDPWMWSSQERNMGILSSSGNSLETEAGGGGEKVKLSSWLQTKCQERPVTSTQRRKVESSRWGEVREEAAKEQS